MFIEFVWGFKHYKSSASERHYARLLFSKKGKYCIIIKVGVVELGIDMHIVPTRNMCNKFLLKVWIFFSYEVKLKFCDNTDDAKVYHNTPTFFL